MLEASLSALYVGAKHRDRDDTRQGLYQYRVLPVRLRRLRRSCSWAWTVRQADVRNCHHRRL